MEDTSKQSQPKSRRVLRVDQIYSRRDRQTHYVQTAKSPLKKGQAERMNKTVLLVRRIISSKGFVTRTEVDIKSEPLRDVLVEINKNVEGLGLNKKPPMLDREELFHCLADLENRLGKEKSESSPNETLISDILTAIEYIREDFGNTLSNLQSLAPHSEIDFETLWAIFPPTAVVISSANIMQQNQAMIFNSGSYRQRPNGSDFYGVDGKILHHDGEMLGWANKTFEIDKFEGMKKIHHLTALPLEKHPDKGSIRTLLLDRGRLYLDLQGHTFREYNGSAVKEVQHSTGEREQINFNATGRIMLDPVAYQQQGPYSHLLRPWVNTPVDVKSLSDKEILCCAFMLLGFSFARKDWGAFAISKASEVTWNENAFDKLVIDNGKRDVVHSLVRSHRIGSGAFDDIVQNKGKGLVGLLSGNPGVGKTLTAEAVAETTKRPLYMVSAGELGTDPHGVDERLDMVLEITRRWGCVLLIDEADVFLETRETRDIERNALVSIFLRRLEYFQGILILTTNRRQTIDPAFQSRIHFKLHYPDLDGASRAAIWRNFVTGLASEVQDVQVSNEDLESLSKTPLNGRQIKNVVSCSVSIAREDKVPLTTERIRTILSVVVDDI